MHVLYVGFVLSKFAYLGFIFKTICFVYFSHYVFYIKYINKVSKTIPICNVH